METSIHSTAYSNLTPLSNPQHGENRTNTSSGNTLDQTEQNSSPKDQVNLSPEGIGASKNNETASASTETSPTSSDQTELSPEQQQQLLDLKSRDREVRLHEQAHLSTAGQYAAGSPSFTYQQGPDGSRYAIGGEVQIDISKESTPEATIQKMETVRAAALAPAEPSAADRAIAAQAAITISQARQEVIQEQQDNRATTETKGATSENDAPGDATAVEPEQVEPSITDGYPNGATVTAMINAYASIQNGV